MSTEEHKAVIRRLFDEAVNHGDLAMLDAIVSPTMIVGADLPVGPEGMKQVVKWLRGVLADIRYTLEDCLAEGERVSVRLSARGTQQGEYLGYPGTGKAVAFAEMMFFRFREGLIDEWWVVADRVSILWQIGVLPAPQ